MDRDQGRFYRDDEFESQEDNQAEVNRGVDDMEYFLELLKHLRTVVEHGGKVPLTNKVVIDAEKCLMIIEDLESNLPDAVQYGMQMYSERTRILGDAEDAAIKHVSSAEMRASAALEKARRDAAQMVIEAEEDARAIIEDAQDRAKHMVSESEIVRRAEEEARVIKNDARIAASEMRLSANHDAYQLLKSIEERLSEARQGVNQMLKEIDNDSID